jgi:hypothetical protein
MACGAIAENRAYLRKMLPGIFTLMQALMGLNLAFFLL